MRTSTDVYQASGLGDFGAFYERAYPMAYRTALGICRDASLADEATQDAFLSAWRMRHRYRGDGTPDAWLLRIVVNAAISSLRRRRVRVMEVLDPSVHDPVDAERDAESVLAIRAALDGLDGRHRAAVVLRYYHDLDYAAIAMILGTSSGNVGSMLSRALARMRPELSDDGPRVRGRMEVTHDVKHID